MSEDEKQSQQVCLSVLKYIYMKTVTMIDSYKERNGYLCWFLSLFLKKILKYLKGNLAMTISSNRYLLCTITFYTQHNSVL